MKMQAYKVFEQLDGMTRKQMHNFLSLNFPLNWDTTGFVINDDLIVRFGVSRLVVRHEPARTNFRYIGDIVMHIPWKEETETAG